MPGHGLLLGGELCKKSLHGPRIVREILRRRGYLVRQERWGQTGRLPPPTGSKPATAHGWKYDFTIRE